MGLLLDTTFCYNVHFLKVRSGRVKGRGEFCRSGRNEHRNICNQLTRKDQKASDKAEYHTNEGEGEKKLKGLRSGSKMFSIDWQYLSLGYLEQNEFFPKTKS